MLFAVPVWPHGPAFRGENIIQNAPVLGQPGNTSTTIRKTREISPNIFFLNLRPLLHMHLAGKAKTDSIQKCWPKSGILRNHCYDNRIILVIQHHQKNGCTNHVSTKNTVALYVYIAYMHIHLVSEG